MTSRISPASTPLARSSYPRLASHARFTGRYSPGLRERSHGASKESPMPRPPERPPVPQPLSAVRAALCDDGARRRLWDRLRSHRGQRGQHQRARAPSKIVTLPFAYSTRPSKLWPSPARSNRNVPESDGVAVHVPLRLLPVTVPVSLPLTAPPETVET